MTSHPVLVVEHEDQCPPGWMGEWLADAGCDLDVRRPYLGDDLPERLDEHAAMVVLGGSMHAYAEDRCPWLAHVKHLVRVAAEERVPTLGICLGHQLAAVALGGAVHTNPRGQQIGVLQVGWRDAAVTDPLTGPVVAAGTAVHWNDDVVSIPPPGTQVLARAVSGELQAARFGPTVWGVQSHPEAGEEIVRAWAESDRDAAAERGVDLDGYVARVAAAREELRTSWRPLAGALAAAARERTRAW